MIAFCRRSFAVLILATLISSIFSPRSALACSCQTDVSASDFLRSYDQIFDGVVEDVVQVNQNEMEAIFKVTKVWKGELGDTARIRFNPGKGTSCGMGFTIGSSGRQFASGRATGPKYTGWCSGVLADVLSRDGALQRELRLYGDRLQALTEDAKDGSTAKRLQLGQFLLAYGDEQQAIRLFEPIIKDEPEAFEDWVVNGHGYDYVGKIESRYWVKPQDVAPARPEAKGQVARAIFVLTGQLDPAWKDWFDLQSLSDCRADGAKLENVTFANSILSGCSFQGASLSHVDLSGIEMRSGSFEGAQLSDVRLDGHSIWNISFRGARLANVSISGAFYGDLSDAELEGVTMTDLNLGGFKLSGATLKNVSFVGGDIRGVETKGASFKNVQFKGTRLLFLKLQGTDLRGADFSAAKELTAYVDCGTRLPDSIKADRPTLIPVERSCPLGRPDGNFRGIDWSYFDLSGLDFRNADFTGATLKGVTLFDTDFSNSNLSRVDFKYSSFSNTVLDGANLEGAANLGWFAASPEETDGKSRPASLNGTRFAGTTIGITMLVGLDGSASSIDLDAPDFSGATIDCSENGTWGYVGRLGEEDLKAQRQHEVVAIRQIQAKWPTVQLTAGCAAHLATMP
jgi:uncharacterized protein YjbI with pentapeptide repeats